MAASGGLSGSKLGKYELRHLLGKGGMGDVYLAIDTQLPREVALKILRDTSEANYLERFKREAETAASLLHPHIVSIHDSGVDNGYYYLVMPLMTGGTLEDCLRNSPNDYFTLERTRDLLDQIAKALDYAHQKEVRHRDVKPGNVLFDGLNNAYLGDFGIAKLANSAMTNLTGVGKIVGTPAYLAPELWQGKGASPASDIYALGITIYRTLTGSLPFVDDEYDELMKKHLHDVPPPSHTIRPDLPPELSRVLEKALAKEPQERYASAGEFSREFSRVVRKHEPTTKPDALPPPIPVIDDKKTDVPPSARWRLWLVIGLVIALLAMVFAPPLLSSILSTPTPLPTATSAAPATATQAPVGVVSPIPTQTPAPSYTPLIIVMGGQATPTSQLSNGVLMAGHPAATSAVSWGAGEGYSICARSRDFDPYLALQTPGGLVVDNDDVAGGDDACILNFVVVAPGTYTLTVSSHDGRYGNYSLEIISYQNCAPGVPMGSMDIVEQTALRSRPYTFSDAVGGMLPNECFAIIGKDERGAWLKIQTPDGRVGWIALALVDVIGSLESVPVLDE